MYLNSTYCTVASWANRVGLNRDLASHWLYNKRIKASAGIFVVTFVGV